MPSTLTCVAAIIAKAVLQQCTHLQRGLQAMLDVPRNLALPIFGDGTPTPADLLAERFVLVDKLLQTLAAKPLPIDTVEFWFKGREPVLQRLLDLVSLTLAGSWFGQRNEPVSGRNHVCADGAFPNAARMRCCRALSSTTTRTRHRKEWPSTRLRPGTSPRRSSTAPSTRPAGIWYTRGCSGSRPSTNGLQTRTSQVVSIRFGAPSARCSTRSSAPAESAPTGSRQA